jgi:hypothetical protein
MNNNSTCHFCDLPTMPWEGEVHQSCISAENARNERADSGKIGFAH